MAKYKAFPPAEELSTMRQECDGLRAHKWKPMTCERGIGTDVSGYCWCETCGALGHWNNIRNGVESITEIYIPGNAHAEF